jgi:pyruvate dehydrogenase E2 component (dihydrolipoamide acetyltransferase)
MIASFGDIEARPLSRIQAITAKAMTRNWTTIPHVTHHDRIDMTELEARRKHANLQRPAEERLSPLPFLIKATAAVLKALPHFNAAFDEAGKALLLRKYVNLGLAIDTPAGLLVGVIRGCDALSIAELARRSKALSDKARAKGLTLSEMSGAGFTISSLGALGGYGFSPIINGPEVAILGVGRMLDEPRRASDDCVEWRSMLPVALSYDHRVLNGADAGRFMLALQSEIDCLARVDVAAGGESA